MGLLGKTADPRVEEAIAQGIQTVRSAGKAAGVLSPQPVLARKYLEHGALFVAVGIDTTLLVRAARELRALFDESADAGR
jgi:4-hydroxy-2-oxoheptanedioate aldolase